jgi:hypothetical protein
MTPIQGKLTGTTLRYFTGCWLRMLVVLAIATVPFFVWLFWTSSPARSAADRFLKSLENGSYAEAFDLCAPRLRKNLGDAGKLQQLVEASRGLYRPWFWTHWSGDENHAWLESEGEVFGKEHGVALELEKCGDRWLVLSARSTVSGQGTLQLAPADK